MNFWVFNQAFSSNCSDIFFKLFKVSRGFIDKDCLYDLIVQVSLSSTTKRFQKFNGTNRMRHFDYVSQPNPWHFFFRQNLKRIWILDSTNWSFQVILNLWNWNLNWQSWNDIKWWSLLLSSLMWNIIGLLSWQMFPLKSKLHFKLSSLGFPRHIVVKYRVDLHLPLRIELHDSCHIISLNITSSPLLIHHVRYFSIYASEIITKLLSGN